MQKFGGRFSRKMHQTRARSEEHNSFLEMTTFIVFQRAYPNFWKSSAGGCHERAASVPTGSIFWKSSAGGHPPQTPPLFCFVRRAGDVVVTLLGSYMPKSTVDAMLCAPTLRAGPPRCPTVYNACPQDSPGMLLFLLHLPITSSKSTRHVTILQDVLCFTVVSGKCIGFPID